MTVKLDLKLDSASAAFDPDFAPIELGRILRLLALKIEGGSEGKFTLRDVNGNACGEAFLEIGEEGEEG